VRHLAGSGGQDRPYRSARRLLRRRHADRRRCHRGHWLSL